MSCNAQCDCCSGNCQNQDTCHLDHVGTARCAAPTCTQPGGPCASAANCCNGLSCVPNPDPNAQPPYLCATSQCAAVGDACTGDADCCVGARCDLPLGRARGMCVTIAVTCALVGQSCTTDADCCFGLPCSTAAGPCIAGQTGCTCH
jgi:hypothetical protein